VEYKSVLGQMNHFLLREVFVTLFVMV